jgi:hypothetical protein
MIQPTAKRMVSMVLSLAWKGALVLFGVSVLVGINAKEEEAPRGDMPRAATGLHATTNEAGKVTVIVGPECDESMSELSIQRPDGRELMNIHVFKSGTMEFTSGKSVPVQARGLIIANGAVSIDVIRDKGRCSLGALPDGSSTAEFVDLCEWTRRGFRVSPDGLFSREASGYWGKTDR